MNTVRIPLSVIGVILACGMLLPVSAAPPATIFTFFVPTFFQGTALTYYVAPSSLSTCTYNGDAGQSCTPSDTNAGTTKALPWATLGHAAAVVKGLHSSSVVTIQLADTTGGTCYQPSSVAFETSSISGPRTTFFEDELTSSAAYPSAYLYILGNTATPTNVLVTGASTCAGTTTSTTEAFRFIDGTYRVSGIDFKYFGDNGTGANSSTITDIGAMMCQRATCYLENFNYTSESYRGYGAVGWYQAQIYLGGTINATNGALIDVLTGSNVSMKTPAGVVTATISVSNISGGGPAATIFANEFGHVQFDGGTWTFEGTSAYTMISGGFGGTVQFNDTGVGQTITFNAANATELSANVGGIIYESCGATHTTCTFTALGKRANAGGTFTGGGMVIISSTTAGTNANTASYGGTIISAAGSSALSFTSFPQVTAANLGTPGNGVFLYCSDCTIANPCAGGGTGALAKRLNGVWVCN